MNNKRGIIFRLKQFIYLVLGWGIIFSVCCMISIPLTYLIILFKEGYLYCFSTLVIIYHSKTLNQY